MAHARAVRAGRARAGSAAGQRRPVRRAVKRKRVAPQAARPKRSPKAPPTAQAAEESDEESTDDEDSDDEEMEKWEEKLLEMEEVLPRDMHPRAREAPHLVSKAKKVPYELAIPTYQRWMPVCQMSKKHRFRKCKMPFILAHTLGMLSRQRIPVSRVTLFVANETERGHYRKALQDSAWEKVRIELSVLGNKNSRNFIMKFFPAGTYVVSIDDDVERISWKIQEGMTHHVLRTLPPGSLETIIFDAYKQMRDHKAFLWGVSTSQNARHMKTYGISKRNGLVNGYLNGYISRPQCKELFRTLSDATEDSEFAVRHFAKDGVVLRYRMYAGITSPYLNRGGLQKKFEVKGERISAEQRSEARKKEERWGALELHRMFPKLIGLPKKRRDKKTMEVCFYSMGYPPGEGKKRIAPQLMDTDRVRYWQQNPKVLGCHAYKLYEGYKTARTLREAVSLGARPIDLAHDYNWGFLSVVDLSLDFPYEVELQEPGKRQAAAHFFWAKSSEKFVKVRIKEMSLGHGGLDIKKESLQLLAEKVPDRFRKLTPEDLRKEGGLLSKMPLVVLRSLLRWAKTGSLRYERRKTWAVYDALKVLGLTWLARRVKQREVEEAKAADKEPKRRARSLGKAWR
ncbi:unnamed protein product [Effrenium voratum]|uniref:Uncharacterized protein n=1 Tax=Effrenium voratum TaxID=2562239 RepID=A0AA36MM92_9DINO|nr:unnamed protein product [Effrenium voratum]